MTTTTVPTHPEQPLTKIQQKINRLKEKEAKIILADRKKRTRQLIELGGLVDKAGLADLPTNQLFGALLTLAEQKSDLSTIHKWEQKGGAAFAKPTPLPTTPIVVSFPDQPSQSIRETLRTLGLRWNKIRAEWEGIANETALTNALQNTNAVVRVLGEQHSLNAC